MMYKWNKRGLVYYPCFFILFLLLFFSCRRQKTNDLFTRHPSGFYYRLISFCEEKQRNNKNHIAVLHAVFSTQRDSVFWNSNMDAFSRFYLKVNNDNPSDDLINYLMNANTGDSVCLLMDKNKFFNYRFYSKEAPLFTRNDSVVKVFFKVSALFNQESLDSLNAVWAANESGFIQSYLEMNNYSGFYKDSVGVFWLSGKPDFSRLGTLNNKTISIKYRGYLLNGKLLDESPDNWQVNSATPDQMLKGINYVIKYMVEGENTKIILPSYLAFGEHGLVNIIPPYTPLLYEVKVIEIVN